MGPFHPVWGHVLVSLNCWTRNPKNVNANDKEAEKLNNILQPLHHAMFVESNPSPVKFAAKQLGLCDDAVRLPLVQVTEQTKEIIFKALKSTKLI